MMTSSPHTLRMIAPAVLLLAVATSPAFGETPERSVAHSKMATVRADTSYRRNGFARFFFGNEWRDVWAAEITVPVLDLGTFAGGLEAFKEGGNQSKTLRFHGGDGRTYVFRSVEKNVRKSLPKDLKKTPANALGQDQVASLHPTGHAAVAVLLEAVEILHAEPMLVYMPDDPRLGKYREDFAHLLGHIEERPDDETKGATFAGAKKIVDTEKLLENLEESMEDRLDSEDYLTARLVDFLVGDTDRGADQWHFAKMERGKRDVYRPIPRDQDYAFMKAEGLAVSLAAKAHPRVVRFGEDYPGFTSLLYMPREFDRSHLVDLSWEQWETVARAIQQRITDDVIERAVMQLPEAHRIESGDEIAKGLRARRDTLLQIAHEYYLIVNREADVFASDEDEFAAIDRNPDGSIDVRLWRAVPGAKPAAVVAAAGSEPAATPVFERRFVPEETREVRVYMERGNDRVVVRGDAKHSINVRVVGGEGDDIFTDSSNVAHGTVTHFYDSSGDNKYTLRDDTRVVTKPFVMAPPLRSLDEEKQKEPEENPREISEERRGRQRDLMPEGDYIESRTGPSARYWGTTNGLTPTTGYRESGGVLLGFGPTATHYSFRHLPHAWRADAHALFGTRNQDFGVEINADRYFENSKWSLVLFARASRLESNRFYGYGNDTERVDPDLSLIERFEVLALPGLRYSFGAANMVTFGPVVKYVNPDIPGESPAAAAAPLGSGHFGQVGGSAELVIDETEVGSKKQSGVGFTTGVSAYPAAWDAEESFGEAHALARVFLPLGWPTLALRAGGQHSWGEFPLHESAFIGGRWTMRGFRWNRYAGDTSAYGAAELRVPVARVTLLTRGQLGVIGFTDAGRVWLDGHSDGEWHTGVGGGLWFGTLDREFSFTYAKGDEHRVYFYVGMPF